MGPRSNGTSDDERADSVRPEFRAGPEREASAPRSATSRRLVTDGGAVEETEGESEADASDDEPDESGSEGEAAESDAAEAEEADEEETEAEEADEADEAEAEEAEAADEEEAEAEEADEEEADKVDEEKTEAEEDDGEAELVHLDLEGLFLNVLGLEVDLNEVVLDVSARSGSNRLLGNLLSSVSGLLDGGPSSLLGGLGSGLSGALNRVLGSVKTALTTVVPFVGGDGGADAEEDADAEGEDDGGGYLPSIGGWIRSGVTRLVAALPLEQVIAQVVRTTLEVLLERTEKEPEDVPGVDEAQEAGEQAGAQS